MKKIILAAALAVVSATSVFAQDAAPKSTWTPPATYAENSMVPNFDIVVGRADAPVTIYEYASLTCPHCRDFQKNTADAIKKEWIDTGKAKLVYRHFPLDQAAFSAALVVNCLPADRRYEAVKLYFDTVEQWASATEINGYVNIVSNAFGKDFALEPGKPLVQSVQACATPQDFQQRSMKPMLDAAQNGVQSTPYFVINGEHVAGARPLADFNSVIERKYYEVVGD